MAALNNYAVAIRGSHKGKIVKEVYVAYNMASSDDAIQMAVAECKAPPRKKLEILETDFIPLPNWEAGFVFACNDEDGDLCAGFMSEPPSGNPLAAARKTLTAIVGSEAAATLKPYQLGDGNV